MRSLVNSLNNFFRSETSSSIVLSVSLLMALVFANWSFTSEFYQSSLSTKVGGLSIQHWINDALMAIFFYLVGMEIKKELVTGALSSQKKAMLPLFAAIGGMVLPALFFSVLNQEQRQVKRGEFRWPQILLLPLGSL